MKTTKDSVQFLRDCEASNPEIRRGNASIRQSQLHVSDVMVQFANSDTMETKIKEVQDYFKNKILSGEFDVCEIHEYYVTVLVDITYQFCIWVGRQNPQEFCKLWDGKFNFIYFDFEKEERAKLHKSMLQIIAEGAAARKAQQIADLEKQLEALKGGANGK